ncbi:MAG: RNA polymerase sigma factor [Bacteroidota bacterium]
MVKKVNILDKTAIDLEQQLIARCIKGERAAQFELYTKYARRMLNVAHRIVRHEEDARDVLQEAFLKAFSNLKTYRHQASFQAWLKRIVINTAINQAKKKGLTIVDKPELLDRAHAEQRSEQRAQIKASVKQAHQALMQLPDGYRTILSLYLLEGYDHQEIAEILNISVSTSLSQYSRGKKKWLALIKKMNEYGQD